MQLDFIGSLTVSETQVKPRSRRSHTHPVAFSADFEAAGPKIPYSDRGWSETASDNYSGMDAYYSEYRRDSLVRNSINALGYFATSGGFDTVLDLINPAGLDEDGVNQKLESYRGLKDFIDEVNRTVGLDDALYTATVKSKIYGRAGFEIILGKDGVPEKLMSRKVRRSNGDSIEGLRPHLSEVDGHLIGFNYGGTDLAFQPAEILWFVNSDLDDDFEGLSDIEPIFHQLGTRRFIMHEAFKETAKSLWAPWGMVRVDTGPANEDDARKMVLAVKNGIKPGTWLVHNQDVTAEAVDLSPRLSGLVQVLEAVDQDVIGNFKVPRFLLGREKQFNRATAFAEAQLFLQGSIKDIQKWLAREVERQWYNMLTALWFKKHGGDVAVKVKHVWRPISIADWVEQAQTWSLLFEKGVVNRDMALEGLGFDPQQIRKQEEESEGLLEAETNPPAVFDIQDNAGKQYRVKAYNRRQAFKAKEPDHTHDAQIEVAQELKKTRDEKILEALGKLVV